VHTDRLKTGIDALEERRVGRQGQQRRAPATKLVGDVHPRLDVLHADVDVKPERHVAERQVSKLMADPLVARGVDESLIPPVCEGVCSTDTDRDSLRLGQSDDRAPQLSHALDRFIDARRNGNVAFEHRMEQLVSQLIAQLVRCSLEQLVHDGYEVTS
jgi:hypothetical protein